MNPSRLSSRFEVLRLGGQKALVAFATAGDPDPERSYQVLDALCRSGADVLELGVPFSDPTADGPVIQRSSERALAAGTTVASVLELVRRLRERHQQPIILFGYYNPFLQFGLERLAREAHEAGVDGFLVVDLPFEEAGPFREVLEPLGLPLIQLVAPTSPPERVAAIARDARGFVYALSRTGVTGLEAAGVPAAADALARLRAAVAVPLCVGFGIARPEQVAAIAPLVDGVVVGSAIVERVEKFARGQVGIEAIAELVRSLKAPLVPTLA